MPGCAPVAKTEMRNFLEIEATATDTPALQRVKPWGDQQRVLHLQGAERGLTYVALMALPNF